MSRTYPMFGLRMPPELKDKLNREAKINGRSLNAEITHLLQNSLAQRGSTNKGIDAGQSNSVPTADITDIERQLLAAFRRLPVEKQLALLSLFN